MAGPIEDAQVLLFCIEPLATLRLIIPREPDTVVDVFVVVDLIHSARQDILGALASHQVFNWTIVYNFIPRPIALSLDLLAFNMRHEVARILLNEVHQVELICLSRLLALLKVKVLLIVAQLAYDELS